MSSPLAPPARRRPSGKGVLALAGALVVGSLVAGAAVAGVAALAVPVAAEIGTSIDRVTIDGRVSILYPRGFETKVTVQDMGGFRWVSAGGFEDYDLRDLEIDNGDDTPDSLWSVRLRGEPASVLGADLGGPYLDEFPSDADFIEAAQRAAQKEFEEGTVIGTWEYDSLDVQVGESPDGAPRVVAIYTWGLSDVEKRWAGEGATAWQTVMSYTLDGATAWRLEATGFVTDEPNETLLEVGTSLRWENR